MANHPNRTGRSIYYWDGSRKFNSITGFHDRIVTRSDGREIKMSARRMSLLKKQNRLIYPQVDPTPA